MAMTNTLTEVLVRHAFYSHFGIIRIAVDDNTLQDPMGDDTMHLVTPHEVSLVEAPGSLAWVDRMIRIRTSLIHAHTTLQNEHNRQTYHLEGLGDALLEEAERRDWCGDYDEFASNWGLPTRVRGWDVTMTVRVNARDEEDALCIVRGEVGLDHNTDDLVEGPEFSAEEA